MKTLNAKTPLNDNWSNNFIKLSTQDMEKMILLRQEKLYRRIEKIEDNIRQIERELFSKDDHPHERVLHKVILFFYKSLAHIDDLFLKIQYFDTNHSFTVIEEIDDLIEDLETKLTHCRPFFAHQHLVA